jgi:hypothetical protein
MTRMPLIIDSSRALRTPQDVAGLVQAIVAASPNDESDWVEWKNGLILQKKDDACQLARHILGMANRRPAEAARHVGGCGYVVIGAEPGSCVGVAEIDPADLGGGIQPYLGPEGPSWSAQYVRHQGCSVLVITIEPPRRGDRIFTLQKEFGKYTAGMVFVRHPGRTVQAGPGDIRALEERYAAPGQPITLHVGPAGPASTVSIRSITNLSPLLDAWEQRRRDELLPPPPRPYGPFHFESDEKETIAATAQVAERAREAFHIADIALNAIAQRDDRTEHEYRAEVERYLSECREYYSELAVARLAQGGALMSLVLVNTSDRNYADVYAEIHVPRRLIVLDPDDFADLRDPPDPPRERGTWPPPQADLPLSLLQGGYLSGLDLPPAQSSPRFTVSASGPFVIVGYDVGRVRPEEHVRLDPVLTFGVDEPARALEIGWTVTTGNVDGIARGAFNASVTEPSNSLTIVPELG